MNNERLESLVKKLTPSIKNTTVNLIYKELVNGPLFESLSRVIDAKSFVILSFLIFFKKKGKYTEGMSVVINNDLFTFSFIEVETNFTEGECEECWGDGYTRCDSCNGNGNETCYDCDGSGVETCYDCDGSGEDEEGKTCQVCGGDNNMECNECGGDGLIRCNDCDGEGTLDCSYCDGQGRWENEDEYEVRQYMYASIDERVLRHLHTLEVEETIEDDIDEITNNLKLTILIKQLSYNTENLTHLSLDSEDVVFIGSKETPNLIYSDNKEVYDRSIGSWI